MPDGVGDCPGLRSRRTIICAWYRSVSPSSLTWSLTEHNRILAKGVTGLAVEEHRTVLWGSAVALSTGH